MPNWDHFLKKLGDRLFRVRDRVDRVADGVDKGEVFKSSWTRFREALRLRIDWKKAHQPTYWRQALLENRIPFGILSVILIAVTGAFAFRRVTAPPYEFVPGQSWFMDVTDGSLFAAPEELVPPIPTPSNRAAPDGRPAGVRAYIYACDDCEPGLKPLFLQTTVPASSLVDLSTAEPADLPPAEALVVLIAKPPASPKAQPDWKRLDSPEGAVIRASSDSMCDGKPAIECTPR